MYCFFVRYIALVYSCHKVFPHVEKCKLAAICFMVVLFVIHHTFFPEILYYICNNVLSLGLQRTGLGQ